MTNHNSIKVDKVQPGDLLLAAFNSSGSKSRVNIINSFVIQVDFGIGNFHSQHWALANGLVVSVTTTRVINRNVILLTLLINGTISSAKVFESEQAITVRHITSRNLPIQPS